jgi:hypothetical protein
VATGRRDRARAQHQRGHQAVTDGACLTTIYSALRASRMSDDPTHDWGALWSFNSMNWLSDRLGVVLGEMGHAGARALLGDGALAPHRSVGQRRRRARPPPRA